MSEPYTSQEKMNLFRLFPQAHAGAFAWGADEFNSSFFEYLFELKKGLGATRRNIVVLF